MPRCLRRKLPEPMLSRPGPLPSGSEWSLEVKWDGFPALVSTEAGLNPYREG